MSSENVFFPKLPGEEILITTNEVTYLCPFSGPTLGTLYVSNYKFMFRETPVLSDQLDDHQLLHHYHRHNQSSSLKNEVQTIIVPLGFINKVEKVGHQTSRGENSYGIEIQCKNTHNLRFSLLVKTSNRGDLFEILSTHAFPLSAASTSTGGQLSPTASSANQSMPQIPISLFAFQFKSHFKGTDDGWSIYDKMKEFTRLQLPSQTWRISEINKEYSICDSYPSLICVPNSVTDEKLIKVAEFRSKGRLPVLSWIHPHNNAAIVRCSQPKVGVAGKRSTDDEDMIRDIIQANGNPTNLCIMDARPRLNAIANQAKGAGYENEAVYQNTELSFLNVENIHVMRNSLKKLRDMCFLSIDNQKWFSNLESTHWLENIKILLYGTSKIVELVEKNNTSVLLHCSDGWDRTSQLSALSMLLLDPYYRTIVGFEVLIEKEWLSFGHKFGQRHGQGDKNHSDEQRSPIFLQFIDCVWQLTLQFPSAFEFNEHFLITVADHSYSNMFGTFLYNCEAHRVKENLKQRTVSLWSFINSQKKEYTNELYASSIQQVLHPVVSHRKIELWKGYHLRWNPRLQVQEAIQARAKQLSEIVHFLRQKKESLENSS